MARAATAVLGVWERMSGEFGQSSRLGSLYVLDHKLGSGGMGTVWAAHHVETNEPVAIKVLSENLAQDPDLVGRFLRERSALLGVHHPNLVRMRDLVAENQRIALVMDLVEGVDTARLLEQQGPQPLARVARLGMEISGALSAVHAGGIVHRDLKPANMLIETATGSAKLVDFGIAWIADNPRLTQANSVVGTPHYLAPELLTGGAVAPAADVYALAICLYQLLSGQVPFDGEHYAQILQKHLTEQPQPHPSIPPTLWSLIEAMLAKDPARRPSVEIVAGQLAGFAGGGSPVIVAPPAAQAQQPGQPGSTPVPGYGQQNPPTPTPAPGYGQQNPPTPNSSPTSTPAPGYGQQSPSTPVPGQTGQNPLYNTSIPLAPVLGGGAPGANDPWESGSPQGVYSTNPPPFTYLPEKRRKSRKPWLIGAIVLVLVATGGVLGVTLSGGGSKTPVTPVAKGTVTASPKSTGTTVASAMVAHHWTLCCNELQDAAGAVAAGSHGVVLNSAKNGDALFDGQSGTQVLINGPIIDTSHSFTIAFWLDMHGKTSTVSGRETIVEQRGKNNCAACVDYDPTTGRFAFQMWSADAASASVTQITAKAAPKSSEWYRIIASYHAPTQTMSFYIGGALQGTATFSAEWVPTGQLSFGSGLEDGTATNWYAGNLSDMWIWNAALTPAQVAQDTAP